MLSSAEAQPNAEQQIFTTAGLARKEAYLLTTLDFSATITVFSTPAQHHLLSSLLRKLHGLLVPQLEACDAQMVNCVCNLACGLYKAQFSAGSRSNTPRCTPG
eukprot:6188260-Pleurochrysis_carterae.AAC.2